MALTARAGDGQVARADDGTFRGLHPDTRYAWTASLDGRPAASGAFTTAPRDLSRGVDLIVFADYGAPNDDSRAVARLAGELDPRLMITGGDNTYIVTLPQLLDDNLFGPLRDALSGAPNYGTVGDHDIPFPVGQKALADALEWPDLGERYDLRYGPVQVVALGLRADAVDVAFARRALARPGPLARFVVTHQPVKAGNPLLPVIAAAPVTAVLAGHLHAYERREVAGAPGVPFFTVGTGGAPRNDRADAPEPRRRRPPPGVRGDARPPGGRRLGVRVHGHRRRRPRPGHVAAGPLTRGRAPVSTTPAAGRAWRPAGDAVCSSRSDPGLPSDKRLARWRGEPPAAEALGTPPAHPMVTGTAP